MSVSRPSQCVFCLFKRSKPLPTSARRAFHPSSSVRRKEPANGPGRKKAQASKELKDVDWKQYYSPEQVEAIEAANKVIPSEKFADGAGPRRHDPWAPKYLDSFSEVDPTVDKPTQAPWENLDDNMRMKTEDEFAEDFAKMIHEADGIMDPDAGEDEVGGLSFEDLAENVRLTTGKEAAELNPPSAMAPSLRSMAKQKKVDKKGDKPARKEEEPTPALIRLMQMTGYDRRDISQLRVKSIISHSVVNQTRLGKVRKAYILSVAGNGNGLLGIGEGKAEEIMEATFQSQYRAIRNMQPIMRYENRTIYGDLEGKVGATELELYARPPGFGLRCQQYIWEMCRCAGIHDLAARVTRARNPMNTVKAAMQALLGQKDPEDIARARGKKLVDVRKVYYAGRV